MNKKINVKKLEKVTNRDSSRPEIKAFQLVLIEINFYGSVITDHLDTKIMQDGSQIIIDGNGFIPSGTNINTLS